MEAKDLMCGNYVYNHNNEICKVCACSQVFDSNLTLDNYSKPNDGTFESAFEVNGIPVTVEMLEKLGFVNEIGESGINKPLKYTILRYGKIWINIYGEGYFEGEVEYVHQLQIIMKMCGIKKEIVL